MKVTVIGDVNSEAQITVAFKRVVWGPDVELRRIALARVDGDIVSCIPLGSSGFPVNFDAQGPVHADLYWLLEDVAPASDQRDDAEKMGGIVLAVGAEVQGVTLPVQLSGPRFVRCGSGQGAVAGVSVAGTLPKSLSRGSQFLGCRRD